MIWVGTQVGGISRWGKLGWKFLPAHAACLPVGAVFPCEVYWYDLVLAIVFSFVNNKVVICSLITVATIKIDIPSGLPFLVLVLVVGGGDYVERREGLMGLCW